MERQKIIRKFPRIHKQRINHRARLQVTPIFTGLTERESTELKEAWQASRKGASKERISALSTFEDTVKEQISADSEVRQTQL